LAARRPLRDNAAGSNPVSRLHALCRLCVHRELLVLLIGVRAVPALQAVRSSLPRRVPRLEADRRVGPVPRGSAYDSASPFIGHSPNAGHRRYPCRGRSAPAFIPRRGNCRHIGRRCPHICGGRPWRWAVNSGAIWAIWSTASVGSATERSERSCVIDAAGICRRASVGSYVHLGCFSRLFRPSCSVSRDQSTLRNGRFRHCRTIEERAARCPGGRRADHSGKYEQAHFPRRTPGDCETTPLRMTSTSPAHCDLRPKASVTDDPDRATRRPTKPSEETAFDGRRWSRRKRS
jgi:hypothetical protein